MRAEYIQDDNTGRCCWNGCCQQGSYPAPKSRQNTRERYHFCLEHIKQYNKSWDFFRGMGSEEIEAFRADSVTGHRPTGYRKTRSYSVDDLQDALFREFDFGDTRTTREPKIPEGELSAMKTLGLKYPATLKDIKRAYKELAKCYHPDVNGIGDEERFKAVSKAYHFLKNCGRF